MITQAISALLVYGPVVAIILFVLARRRSPAQPTCGHCGYNLAGATSASVVCPECGWDLRAVAVPANTVRWYSWLIVLAVLLAVPCVLFFAFLLLIALCWR